MTRRHCIIGATRGTGLLVVQQLVQAGRDVLAIARDQAQAGRILPAGVQVRTGDVTDVASLRSVLDGDFTSIFFTVAATGGVDGRALFAAKASIREVTYQGLLNVLEAAASSGFSGRIVLPSVLGVDRSSLMMSLLGFTKAGLPENLRERERQLRASGLDYMIVRAPILTNGPPGAVAIGLTGPSDKLTAAIKISRHDLAQVLIQASDPDVSGRKTFNVLPAPESSLDLLALSRQLETVPPDEHSS